MRAVVLIFKNKYKKKIPTVINREGEYTLQLSPRSSTLHPPFGIKRHRRLSRCGKGTNSWPQQSGRIKGDISRSLVISINGGRRSGDRSWSRTSSLWRRLSGSRSLPSPSSRPYQASDRWRFIATGPRFRSFVILILFGCWKNGGREKKKKIFLLMLFLAGKIWERN